MVKLTLKNFRCYTSQVFEFEDNDLTLISGPSGRGKTTILLAIQFALYGSSNHKYLVSHNKTSCEVILEYKNFKVKRTKRPNILNLEMGNKFYEDKEAQVLINKYFGAAFGAANSSLFFMDLTTDQKMEFLEKIVNTDCDVKELKNKIKIEISNLNKELAIIDGQILNTESMLEIIHQPLKVEKPINEGEEELTNLSEEELSLRKEDILKQIEKNQRKKNKQRDFLIQKGMIESQLNEQINELNETQIDHKIQNKIDKWSQTLTNLKVKNNHMSKLKDQYLIATENLKELEKYTVEEKDLETINSKIKQVDEELELSIKLMDFKTLEQLTKEYNDNLDQERELWQNKVNCLQNQINTLKLQIQDINQPLKVLEKIMLKYKDCETFNSKNSLDAIKEEVQSLKLKFFKSYTCSKCNHNFVIHMDTFEMASEEDSSTNNTGRAKVSDLEQQNIEQGTKQSLKKVKERLNTLENLRLQYEENQLYLEKTDIKQIVNKINLLQEYDRSIKSLKEFGNFQPSLSLSKIEKNIIKLKSTLPSDFGIAEQILIGCKEPDLLKDEKRDLVVQQNKIKQQLKIKNDLLKKTILKEEYDPDEHSNIMSEINHLTDLLDKGRIELEKYKNFIKYQEHIKMLEGKIQALNTEIKNLNYEDKVPELELSLKNVEDGLHFYTKLKKYNNYLVELNKYEKVKNTLFNLIERKKNVEQIYLKTLIFKQKVIEAEQESLEGIINIINTHLNLLLEDFFSESFGDPIQIFLELTNDKRPQVNTVINYKGNKVDYKSLSTGEYARVKLAFDLTFKEILGESIIMLDECTANLDQDLSTKIFNKIKGYFPSKTILVVAHQVVMGTFDHVLKI
jgi:DNA repair exonuclease SbcCD ATPase subunit